MKLADLPNWPNRHKLIFFIVCWTIFSCYYFLKNQFGYPPMYWLELVATLPVFVLIAHGVFFLLNRIFVQRHAVSGVVMLAIAYVLVFLLAHSLVNWVNPYLPEPFNDGKPIAATNPYFLQTTITVLINFSVVAVVFFLIYRVVEYANARRLEAEAKVAALQQALDAEHEKRQYEYLALAGEVPPHFYANMVLSWKAQLGDQHRQVGESMERMHDLLMYHVEAREPGREVVPLQREIYYMLLYLELINKPSSPVFVTYELAGNTSGLTIPPTTLISFVNNAIKHGVANDPKRPIRILLTVKLDVLVFCCINSIKTVPDQKSHGVGLANVRRRLDIQYEGAYALETRAEGETYRVDLIIHY